MRLCSIFDATHLRYQAASGRRDYIPRTAIAQRTHLHAALRACVCGALCGAAHGAAARDERREETQMAEPSERTLPDVIPDVFRFVYIHADKRHPAARKRKLVEYRIVMC